MDNSGTISTTVYNWLTDESRTYTFDNTNYWEYPVKTRESVEDEKIASIAESVANNILGNFFREITDENLKVDVDALQHYIDNFMNSES